MLKNILGFLGLVACFVVLKQTGPNEPTWLPYVAGILLVLAVGLAADELSSLPYIDPESDEHRDNSIG